MSNTVKAAWIGATAVVIAAIIAGLFALFASPSNTTQGDCSGIITGDVSGQIIVDCNNNKGSER